MISFVDLNGGELAKLSDSSDIENFPVRALTVAHCLVELNQVLLRYNYIRTKPSFGFQFPHDLSGEVKRLIRNVSILLPKGVEFYSIDGKDLFELRGPSGGIVSGLTCYLIAT